MDPSPLGAKYAEVGCKSMDTFGCMYAVVGFKSAETFGCKVCGCWVQVSPVKKKSFIAAESLPDSR